MTEPLREWVVRYAFDVDVTSMSRAESGTKAAEDRIVAANAAALAKRVAEERRAQRARIDTIVKANGDLSQEDRRFIVEDLKRHQEAEAAKVKAQDESFKRQRQRFDEIAKAGRQFALNMTGIVAGVAAAIGASTGGLLTATDRAAKQFERLKYMAESSGSSVKGLQAFGYGIAQLGGNAETAEAQLTEFGNKLKTFPQFEKNLQSMGIATRDAGGQMKDAADIARDYMGVLGRMPRATQDALGEVYGFSASTIRAGTRAGLGTYMAEERAHRAEIGVDGDVAGERGAAFERSMRRLSDDIASVKLRIETALMDLFKPALERVAGWVEANGKAISTVVIAIARSISEVVSAFVDTGIVRDSMKLLSDSLHEFAGYISSGDFKKDIKGFVHDLAQLAKVIRWSLEKLGILGGEVMPAVTPAPVGVNEPSDGPSTGASLRNRRGGGGHQTVDDEHFAGVRARKLAFGRAGFQGLGSDQARANAAAVQDELQKAGLPEEGVAAGLGSAQTESTFNPNADNGSHHGLYQWDGTRWAKVSAWIRGQGGDPNDARWQTRAWIAEGRAKPGDAIYDSPQTQGGWASIEGSKGDLAKALRGVERDERYGSGEGGRGAHAQAWLDRMRGVSTTPPASGGAAPDGTLAGDISGDATYHNGNLDGVKGFIVHHTGGGGSPEGVVHTLNQRGLGVQFVMGRDGKIFRSLPDGARGAHILRSEINDLSNANTMGMEVVARDDADVTPAQVKAGKAFLDAMAKKYPGLQVFGHGEVNPHHKMASEGRSIVEAYRAGRAAPKTDPNYVPPPVPMAQRTLQGYMGRDTPAKVEITDGSAFKLGQAFVSSSPLLKSGPGRAGGNTLGEIHASWQRYADAHGKELHHPGLVSPAEQQRRAFSVSHVRHNENTITHSPTYNVHASDVKTGLEAAKRQGERGAADLVRNVQPMLA